MLSPTLDTVRLFLHVLAASVWVGGQIVLAGLVPSLKRSFPGSSKVIAQAYGRIAWPAFGLVVITGLWSIAEIDVTDTSTAYQITLLAKISLAMISGTAAAVHQVGHSKAALAIGGAVGLLTALGAMLLGVLLSTGA